MQDDDTLDSDFIVIDDDSNDNVNSDSEVDEYEE